VAPVVMSDGMSENDAQGVEILFGERDQGCCTGVYEPVKNQGMMQTLKIPFNEKVYKEPFFV